MHASLPPLPSMPSWHGAQLKHRDNFTFNMYVILRGWRDTVLKVHAPNKVKVMIQRIVFMRNLSMYTVNSHSTT
jgi:hypothetical protein